MLVIDNHNLKFLNDGWFSLAEVLNRFPLAKLNLSETKIEELLNSGEIDTIHKYRNWTKMRTEFLKDDLNNLSKSELNAVLSNSNIAKQVLKSKIPVKEFALNNKEYIYANITLAEALEAGLTFADVIHNRFTSSRVKYGLIENDFKEGRLPATTEDQLAKYTAIDLLPAVANTLKNIEYPEPLIAADLLRSRSIRKNGDVVSRISLSLCGPYNRQATLLALTNNQQFDMADIYFANLKGPSSIFETKVLLDELPKNRSSATYLANQGKLGMSNFDEVKDFVMTYGNEADILSLYQNQSLDANLRFSLYDFVSVAIPPTSYRHMLFNTYIVDCDVDSLAEFCNLYSPDGFIFYYLQSPEAYIRSSIYAIEHCSQCTVSADEILTKCVDLKFDKAYINALMRIIIAESDFDAALRFYLTDGIPVVYKSDLYKKLHKEQ